MIRLPNARLESGEAGKSTVGGRAAVAVFDEVICSPASADPAQVELLADARG